MPFQGFRRRKGTQEINIRDNAAKNITAGNHDVEMCKKHPQTPLELVCEDCKMIYCTVCIATNVHKRSKYHKLKYISEVADEFAKSKEYVEHNERISNLKESLKRSKDMIDQNIKLSEQLKDEADKVIKQNKDNLIFLIETQCEDILQQNDNKKNANVSRLRKLAEQNVALDEELVQTEQQINEKKGTSNMCPLLIAVLKSKQDVERIEKDIRKLNKSSHVTRYVFAAGDQTLNFMKTKEDFGNLVEMNLDNLEMTNSSESDESLDMFDDDYNSTSFQKSRKGAHQWTDSMQSIPASVRQFHEYPANFQPPLREAIQKSKSTLSLPLTTRLHSDSTERWKRKTPAYMISKPLTRHMSIPSIAISNESSGLQDEGYLEPQNSDTAVDMLEHLQLSNSKESLKYLSTSSGAVPKRCPKPAPKPAPKPKPAPRPLAQAEKHERARNNSSYDVMYHNDERQAQNMPDTIYMNTEHVDKSNHGHEKPLPRHHSVPLDQISEGMAGPQEGEDNINESTENVDKSNKRHEKPLSRHISVPWDPISEGFAGLRKEEGFLDPQNRDAAVAMTENGQLSNSYDSLNSLSTCSGAKPKIKSDKPPKPGPKPSAQAIKQARERSKLLYGLEQQNLDQQTQNMQEKYKVLYSFTPENEEDTCFNEGDIVTVLQKCTDGWYAVELNGQHGYIPKDYLEKTVLHASIRSELENKFRAREFVYHF